MRALFVFICPPLAVLSCWKPISAMFNCFLCMFFWVPGVFHAMMVVQQHHEKHQTTRVVKAIRRGPAARKTKRKAARPKKEKVCYDDPFIGESGTRFKRRA
jgi:uncharacterized membrane protein YqaE (UPF0057 family)